MFFIIMFQFLHRSFYLILSIVGVAYNVGNITCCLIIKRYVKGWISEKIKGNKLGVNKKKSFTICKILLWVVVRTCYFSIIISFYLYFATYFTTRV